MTPPNEPAIAELAAEPLDATDEQLLAQLAAAYDDVDPVPDGLIERLRFGITLDALHAEIAELQRFGDLVGVRSEQLDRPDTITFSSSTVTLMITVSVTSPETARVDGWLVPATAATVELRSPVGARTTTADADGRFAFDDVTRGPVQFTIRAEGADRPVVTPSVEL